MTELAPILDVAEIPGTVRISGKIIARDVAYAEFLNGFEGQHVEWINGVVIQMASIDERHDALIGFLRMLLSAFLERTGGGRILGDPMVMRLDTVPSSRAPDIQVLLPDRLGYLRPKEVVGPASLVIEIVSAGSQRQDRVDKRREYELGGVPEYWIIDWSKREALFLQLNEAGLYEENLPDEAGIYHSVVLGKFALAVELLWRESLPGYTEVGQLVAAMLADS